MERSLTGTLVDYAVKLRYEDIPAPVIGVQKDALADLLAVMAAATTLGEGTAPFTGFAAQAGAGGRCTLLGAGGKVTPMMAALANGALCHALDFEDAHAVATVHSNSASTPALLALAEHMGGCSGRELLTALVLASDICCRLDLGCEEDLLKYGWYMPPIHGGMGAVFGAARLLGLDEGATRDALALGLSQITGSGEAANARASVVRTVREGFAAQAAVQSALLAAQGVHARFEEPFEGRLGYFHMYARGHYRPERVLEGVGERFESEFTDFKPWPSCRATHTAVGALLALRGECGIAPDEVERIHLRMHEVGRMLFEPAEAKYRPGAAGVAKFSMPFVLATALCRGRVTLEDFDPASLEDEAVLSLAGRVSYEIDPALTKAENKKVTLTVSTTRGVFERSAEHPLGCRENPMTGAQLKAKFDNCMRRSVKDYTAGRIEAIWAAVRRLEELDDVRQLTALL